MAHEDDDAGGPCSAWRMEMATQAGAIAGLANRVADAIYARVPMEPSSAWKVLSRNSDAILGVDIRLPTGPGPNNPDTVGLRLDLRADKDCPSQEYPRTAERFVAPYFNFMAIRHQ